MYPVRPASAPGIGTMLEEGLPAPANQPAVSVAVADDSVACESEAALRTAAPAARIDAARIAALWPEVVKPFADNPRLGAALRTAAPALDPHGRLALTLRSEPQMEMVRAVKAVLARGAAEAFGLPAIEIELRLDDTALVSDTAAAPAADDILASLYQMNASVESLVKKLGLTLAGKVEA